MSLREAGSFEHAHRAVLKLGDECRAVVDVDFAHGTAGTGGGGETLHRVGERALLDKRLLHSHDRAEIAGEEAGEVDEVRAEVAERAGAADILLKPPDKREIGVDDEVLEI